jgi:competence protein ComFB
MVYTEHQIASEEGAMSIQDQIHNYYETKVIEQVMEISREHGYSNEQMVDLCCIALNNLPTRYFRHEVDLAFYMSAHEHDDINRRVRQAVNDAIAYMKSQRG